MCATCAPWYGLHNLRCAWQRHADYLSIRSVLAVDNAGMRFQLSTRSRTLKAKTQNHTCFFCSKLELGTIGRRYSSNNSVERETREPDVLLRAECTYVQNYWSSILLLSTHVSSVQWLKFSLLTLRGKLWIFQL
jgi:hypothetical protein